MKRSRKKTWRALLRFRCTGCAACCTQPVVPVTAQDVARIMRSTGQTARDVVHFFGPDEVKSNPGSTVWIKLRQGKRLMGLRRIRDHCHYLQNSRCLIYAHRPVTCRLFPFNIFYNSKGCVESLEINDIVKCDYALEGRVSLERIQALYSQDERQDEAFASKVRRWNTQRPNGTAREFLAFLGLEENSPQEKSRELK
ncbi:MAG: YkgJ family cysteine cluster protein [bacterium]